MRIVLALLHRQITEKWEKRKEAKKMEIRNSLEEQDFEIAASSSTIYTVHIYTYIYFL